MLKELWLFKWIRSSSLGPCLRHDSAKSMSPPQTPPPAPNSSSLDEIACEAICSIRGGNLGSFLPGSSIIWPLKRKTNRGCSRFSKIPNFCFALSRTWIATVTWLGWKERSQRTMSCWIVLSRANQSLSAAVTASFVGFLYFLCMWVCQKLKMCKAYSSRKVSLIRIFFWHSFSFKSPSNTTFNKLLSFILICIISNQMFEKMQGTTH